MEKYFGTDGIRGKANQHPMTITVAMAVGRAVAGLVREAGCTRIIIGRDTRRSGAMLEAALAAGAASRGVDVRLAGVIPTPGVAFLVKEDAGAGAGLVISASHNPYYDNGIKVFRRDGYKLSDEEEAFLEEQMQVFLAHPLSSGDADTVSVPEPGDIFPLVHAHELYVDFLRAIYMQQIERSDGEGAGSPLSTGNSPAVPSRGASAAGAIPIVIDCANGAAYQVARQLFVPPLFDARFIHASPDGVNINTDCGSQHTKDLSQAVVKAKACAGLAFDGDADRLIALDEKGNPVTGDKILAICAVHAAARGELSGRQVVSTVMSNIGLGKALARHGIEHTITDVGDRKVMQAMAETGAVMGGEDSGHMIFSRHHTTGDGMLTALMLLAVMTRTGQSLSRLASLMTVYPQVLKNVSVSPQRPDFMSIPAVARAIRNAETELADTGRILVRYSGTQPLLRVMVEGPAPDRTEEICDEVCQVVRSAMGG